MADDGALAVKDVAYINAYLVPSVDVVVEGQSQPIASLNSMSFGSMPNDGGHLLLDVQDVKDAREKHHVPEQFLRPLLGSEEYINGTQRWCIWINTSDYPLAQENQWLKKRFNAIELKRRKSSRTTTARLSNAPYRFGEVRQVGDETVIIVPIHSSELRSHLPVGLLASGSIISNAAYGLFDAPLWNMALIASKLHLVWIATVCGKLETRYRYSNTLGWNTFPVPLLTEQNKAELTRCAENILLAREAHFPKTIADLYDPAHMPENLRAAHDHNDETLERIYIGRRFKNDTERLEKLFALYTRMTAATAKKAPAQKAARR